MFNAYYIPLCHGSFKFKVGAGGNILERGLTADSQEIFCIIIISLLLLPPSVRVPFNLILSETVSFNLILLVFFMV